MSGRAGPAFGSRNAVRLCLFAGLLAGMVGTASLVQEREIIFPEIAVVLGLSGLASAAHCLFLAAPPLLVAYTQMTRRTNPVRKLPLQVIAGVFCCSTIGTACRLALPAFPTLAAFGAAVLIALFFILRRFYFPPIAAMGILAFLVPPSQLLLYPLAATAGMAVLCLATRRGNRVPANGR